MNRKVQRAEYTEMEKRANSCPFHPFYIWEAVKRLRLSIGTNCTQITIERQTASSFTDKHNAEYKVSKLK